MRVRLQQYDLVLAGQGGMDEKEFQGTVQPSRLEGLDAQLLPLGIEAHQCLDAEFGGDALPIQLLVDGQALLVIVVHHHGIGVADRQGQHQCTHQHGAGRYGNDEPGPELAIPGGGKGLTVHVNGLLSAGR